MFSLQDKIALVTGAASGIGEAIAHCYSRAGARVYVADRDETAACRVAEAICCQGGNAAACPVDVGSAISCSEAAARVLATHPGGIDILVNNAGVGHVGTILETDEAAMDRLYTVNVKGAYFLSRLFLPKMVERRDGSIIHLASIGGVVGVKDRFAYCMSKFAVVGMTKAMALDHAESNVRVNCICPARVETPFVQARIAEYPDPAKAYAQMTATQPVGRMARPEEIAAAALYLASDEAAFVTGSEFVIDGGFSAG